MNTLELKSRLLQLFPVFLQLLDAAALRRLAQP
jgi:hypothetical protein